jgi:hypothetical protein
MASTPELAARVTSGSAAQRSSATPLQRVATDDTPIRG